MTLVTRKARPRTRGQPEVQLRAHVRAAFASQTIGALRYPLAILFHIELA
jgi:hypothetical protein